VHEFIIPEERTGYILLKMILNVLGHEMECKYFEKKVVPVPGLIKKLYYLLF
jgi:hypothetical protein